MDLLKIHLPKSLYDKLIIDSFTGESFTFNTIVNMDEEELAFRANLSEEDALNIKWIVIQVLFGSRLTTGDKLTSWTRLKTGNDLLDSFFNSGLPAADITEITGASGVGKTQLCLQLALYVQLPESIGGFDKAAVYICTEDLFPIKRLKQMSEHFSKKYHSYLDNHFQFCDNIFIKHVVDYYHFDHLLNNHLAKLLKHRAIGLIVIDSIAGLFRSNQDLSYVERASEFTAIAQRLNNIAMDHRVVVICTNQVTDNTQTGRTEPCLGLAWSNVIRRRFQITRDEYNRAVRTIRKVFVDYELVENECKFTIEECGITSNNC